MKSLDNCTSYSLTAKSGDEYAQSRGLCFFPERESGGSSCSYVHTTIKNIYLTGRRCKSFLDMSE